MSFDFDKLRPFSFTCQIISFKIIHTHIYNVFNYQDEILFDTTQL